jgi:FkbM family methyltransferase
MSDILRKHVRRRNPFAATRIPLYAKAYLRAHAKYADPARRLFVGLPSRLIFRGLRSLGACAGGGMTYARPDAKVAIRFDARNTQFHSVYAPAYRDGYEPETAALLDLLIADDATFFDIGANWGHFTLYVGSRPGFRGNIHSFEPHPGTFRDLAGCVRQAALEKQVTCHNVALSDAPGRGTLVFPDRLHSGLATLRAGAPGVSVTLRALDELGLPSPAVIKLDVEGHEEKVLLGARQTIALNRPMILFESWRDFRKPAETLGPFRVLESAGYVFFQPAFAFRAGGAEYVLGYGQYDSLPEEADLALVPFAARERFLLNTQVNVLACHSARLPELRSIFAC